MNILVVGDPHLKASNLNGVKVFLDWVSMICKTEKIDLVVILGDTFHTHNVVRTEVMALVTNFVDDISSILPLCILVGNHDMAHHKTPHLHAWLPFMKRNSNLRIIDKPVFGKGFSFLPYIDDIATFTDVLEKSMSYGDFIFCHQTFLGANFGFIQAKEGTTVPTDYKGLIVAGHIHRGQTMGPVWYPGTPFAQESADHNETKGIYLLDTDTRDRIFFKSPLPQWITVHATPLDFESVIQSMDKNNKNHLVLSGPGPELQALMDTKLFTELKKEYGFSVKKQQVNVNLQKTVKQVSTLEGAIVDYVDNIYQGSVDKEALKVKCLESLK